MNSKGLLLEAVNIHKSYRSANAMLHVLKGIDIRIADGEIVSMVGPSGAGKSTLLHILGGLDVPEKGTVTLQGEDIYSLNDAKRAKIRNGKIGFIFQFYHLLQEFTALENVLLPALIKSDERDSTRLASKGKALLKQVGLEKRATHKPYQLSGGEQQRVAIARALINQPAIIFCDEPTGNLDSQTGKEIIGLLKDLNTHNSQTFVIVTHDQEISRMSHRTIQMQDGRLI